MYYGDRNGLIQHIKLMSQITNKLKYLVQSTCYNLLKNDLMYANITMSLVIPRKSFLFKHFFRE